MVGKRELPRLGHLLPQTSQKTLGNKCTLRGSPSSLLRWLRGVGHKYAAKGCENPEIWKKSVGAGYTKSLDGEPCTNPASISASSLGMGSFPVLIASSVQDAEMMANMEREQAGALALLVVDQSVDEIAWSLRHESNGDLSAHAYPLPVLDRILGRLSRPRFHPNSSTCLVLCIHFNRTVMLHPLVGPSFEVVEDLTCRGGHKRCWRIPASGLGAVHDLETRVIPSLRDQIRSMVADSNCVEDVVFPLSQLASRLLAHDGNPYLIHPTLAGVWIFYNNHAKSAARVRATFLFLGPGHKQSIQRWVAEDFELEGERIIPVGKGLRRGRRYMWLPSSYSDLLKWAMVQRSHKETSTQDFRGKGNISAQFASTAKIVPNEDEYLDLGGWGENRNARGPAKLPHEGSCSSSTPTDSRGGLVGAGQPGDKENRRSSSLVRVGSREVESALPSLDDAMGASVHLARQWSKDPGLVLSLLEIACLGHGDQGTKTDITARNIACVLISKALEHDQGMKGDGQGTDIRGNGGEAICGGGVSSKFAAYPDVAHMSNGAGHDVQPADMLLDLWYKAFWLAEAGSRQDGRVEIGQASLGVLESLLSCPQVTAGFIQRGLLRQLEQVIRVATAALWQSSFMDSDSNKGAGGERKRDKGNKDVMEGGHETRTKMRHELSGSENGRPIKSQHEDIPGAKHTIPLSLSDNARTTYGIGCFQEKNDKFSPTCSREEGTCGSIVPSEDALAKERSSSPWWWILEPPKSDDISDKFGGSEGWRGERTEGDQEEANEWGGEDNEQGGRRLKQQTGGPQDLSGADKGKSEKSRHSLTLKRMTHPQSEKGPNVSSGQGANPHGRGVGPFRRKDKESPRVRAQSHATPPLLRLDALGFTQGLEGSHSPAGGAGNFTGSSTPTILANLQTTYWSARNPTSRLSARPSARLEARLSARQTARTGLTTAQDSSSVSVGGYPTGRSLSPVPTLMLRGDDAPQRDKMDVGSSVCQPTSASFSTARPIRNSVRGLGGNSESPPCGTATGVTSGLTGEGGGGGGGARLESGGNGERMKRSVPLLHLGRIPSHQHTELGLGTEAPSVESTSPRQAAQPYGRLHTPPTSSRHFTTRASRCMASFLTSIRVEEPRGYGSKDEKVGRECMDSFKMDEMALSGVKQKPSASARLGPQPRDFGQSYLLGHAQSDLLPHAAFTSELPRENMLILSPTNERDVSATRHFHPRACHNCKAFDLVLDIVRALGPTGTNQSESKRESSLVATARIVFGLVVMAPPEVEEEAAAALGSALELLFILRASKLLELGHGSKYTRGPASDGNGCEYYPQQGCFPPHPVPPFAHAVGRYLLLQSVSTLWADTCHRLADVRYLQHRRSDLGAGQRRRLGWVRAVCQLSLDRAQVARLLLGSITPTGIARGDDGCGGSSVHRPDRLTPELVMGILNFSGRALQSLTFQQPLTWSEPARGKTSPSLGSSRSVGSTCRARGGVRKVAKTGLQSDVFDTAALVLNVPAIVEVISLLRWTMTRPVTWGTDASWASACLATTSAPDFGAIPALVVLLTSLLDGIAQSRAATLIEKESHLISGPYDLAEQVLRDGLGVKAHMAAMMAKEVVNDLLFAILACLHDVLARCFVVLDSSEDTHDCEISALGGVPCVLRMMEPLFLPTGNFFAMLQARTLGGDQGSGLNAAERGPPTRGRIPLVISQRILHLCGSFYGLWGECKLGCGGFYPEAHLTLHYKAFLRDYGADGGPVPDDEEVSSRDGDELLGTHSGERLEIGIARATRCRLHLRALIGLVSIRHPVVDMKVRRLQVAQFLAHEIGTEMSLGDHSSLLRNDWNARREDNSRKSSDSHAMDNNVSSISQASAGKQISATAGRVGQTGGDHGGGVILWRGAGKDVEILANEGGTAGVSGGGENRVNLEGQRAAGVFKKGDRVDGLVVTRNGRKRWFPGVVSAVNTDGTLGILYDDGDRDTAKTRAEVRTTKKVDHAREGNQEPHNEMVGHDLNILGSTNAVAGRLAGRSRPVAGGGSVEPLRYTEKEENDAFRESQGINSGHFDPDRGESTMRREEVKGADTLAQPVPRHEEEPISKESDHELSDQRRAGGGHDSAPHGTISSMLLPSSDGRPGLDADHTEGDDEDDDDRFFTIPATVDDSQAVKKTPSTLLHVPRMDLLSPNFRSLRGRLHSGHFPPTPNLSKRSGTPHRPYIRSSIGETGGAYAGGDQETRKSPSLLGPVGGTKDQSWADPSSTMHCSQSRPMFRDIDVTSQGSGIQGGGDAKDPDEKVSRTSSGCDDRTSSRVGCSGENNFLEDGERDIGYADPWVEGAMEDIETDVTDEEYRMYYVRRRSMIPLYQDPALHEAALLLLLSLASRMPTAEMGGSVSSPILPSKQDPNTANGRRAPQRGGVNIMHALECHVNHPDNSSILPGFCTGWARLGPGAAALGKLVCSAVFDADSYFSQGPERVAGGRFGEVFVARSPLPHWSVKAPRMGASSGPGGRDWSMKRVEDGQVAIKLVDREGGASGEAACAGVYTEVMALKTLADVPGVCHLLDFGLTKTSYAMILERCLSSLKEWRLLRWGGEIDEDNPAPADGTDEVLLYLGIYWQIVSAVAATAERGVIHHDLKCDNILVRGSPANGHNGNFEVGGAGVGAVYGAATRKVKDTWAQLGVPCVCITDFGEASLSEGVLGRWSRVSNGENSGDNFTVLRARGTECIQSPEMLAWNGSATNGGNDNYGAEIGDRGRFSGGNGGGDGRGLLTGESSGRSSLSGGASQITPASDVWSLGCLLYELLSGRFLFDSSQWSEFFVMLTGPNSGFSECASDVRETVTPLPPPGSMSAFNKLGSSALLEGLLSFILIRNPDRRPKAKALLQRLDTDLSALLDERGGGAQHLQCAEGNEGYPGTGTIISCRGGSGIVEGERVDTLPTGCAHVPAVSSLCESEEGHREDDFVRGLRGDTRTNELVSARAITDLPAAVKNKGLEYHKNMSSEGQRTWPSVKPCEAVVIFRQETATLPLYLRTGHREGMDPLQGDRSSGYDGTIWTLDRGLFLLSPIDAGDDKGGPTAASLCSTKDTRGFLPSAGTQTGATPAETRVVRVFGRSQWGPGDAGEPAVLIDLLPLLSITHVVVCAPLSPHMVDPSTGPSSRRVEAKSDWNKVEDLGVQVFHANTGPLEWYRHVGGREGEEDDRCEVNPGVSSPLSDLVQQVLGFLSETRVPGAEAGNAGVGKRLLFVGTKGVGRDGAGALALARTMLTQGRGCYEVFTGFRQSYPGFWVDSALLQALIELSEEQRGSG